MKGLAFILSVFWFSLPTMAQSLEQFECSNTLNNLQIQGQKQECKDSRYQLWQKNGCYQVKISFNDQQYQFEMVRNLRFELEQRQGFFSMYTYDKHEYILQGLIIEFKKIDSNTLSRMRFDTRDNNRARFNMIPGFCQILEL